MIEYIRIIKSTGLKAHITILAASFSVSLVCYSFVYFQEKTLAEIITPQSLWLLFAAPSCLIIYASWGGISKLLSVVRSIPLENALLKTGPAFLFFLVLPGALLRHVSVPSGLFVIIAVTGFSSILLWLFIPSSMRWSLSEKAARRYLAAGALLFACIFSILGIWRYLAFRTFADFALFAHQIWGFSQFIMVQLYGNGLHPFGNHISPVLLLLTPFYWIWPDPRMIFCIQNTVIALGVIPLYWLTRDHLKSPIAGVVICFAYLLYPALQLSAATELHESHLITTPFLFTFYFLQKRAYGKFFICGLLTLMCKEDVALLIGMCGLYMAFKRKEYIIGGSVGLFSVIWLFVGVFIIMPAYEHGGSWYLQFFIEGGAGEETARAMQSEGLNNIREELLQSDNITFLLQLLVPVGVLSVFAPAELLIAIPTILELIVYTGPPFGLVGTIYTWHVMAVVPTIFISAIYGIKHIMEKYGDASLFPCLSIITGSTILCNMLYGVLPFSIRYDFSDFKITDHDRIGHTLLKQIPPDVSVSTSAQLAAHLVNRKHIYALPQPWEKSGWRAPDEYFPTQVDYVVADTSHNVIREMTLEHQEGFLRFIRRIGRDPLFEVVASQDGYVIYRQKKLNEMNNP